MRIADATQAAPAPARGAPPSPMRLLANQLTAVRLVLIPVLWTLAVLRRPVPLGTVLVLAGLTDVLDGLVARRTRTATRFGGAFDSLADHLLSASTVAFIVLLEPRFVREQRVPLAAWALFGLATLAYGWIRHHRFGNLHLYSAKTAGVAGYLFAATLFFLPGYSRPFFAVALAMAFVATTETLLVFATRARVDEHAGSLLLRRSGGNPPRGRPGGG
jgi:phosphatidylglycerophosphate synthase